MADMKSYLDQLESGVVKTQQEAEDTLKNIELHKEALEALKLQLATIKREYELVKDKLRKLNPTHEYEQLDEYWEIQRVYTELNTKQRVIDLQDKINNLEKSIRIKEESYSKIMEGLKSE